jgi:hypothetical protein
MTDTGTGTAASDLGMAADDRPSSYPAGLSGFAKRSSGNNVDQRGQLRYSRTAEQLQQDRRDWIESFDRAKASMAFVRGENMSKYSDEARAEHIARFDRAAVQDGYSPVEPPSAELQRHADLHLVALNPKPTDYAPQQLGAHGQHVGEMTSLAAKLGFAPTAGNAFIERLVAVADQKKSMSPEQLDFWAGQQRAFLLRRAGGDEKVLSEQVDAVVAELGRVRGVGRQLAQAIPDDAVLVDPAIFLSLLNHSRARQSFEASRPDRRR